MKISVIDGEYAMVGFGYEELHTDKICHYFFEFVDSFILVSNIVES
jgi:hypothetical protein